MRYAGRTPSDVLGVAEGASISDVKKAFFRRARTTHPDAPGGSAEAFREVQAAFDALRRGTPREERPARPPGPTPYDPWMTRPRVARQWDDDDPVVSRRVVDTRRRPTFAEVLAGEMRRGRPRAA